MDLFTIVATIWRHKIATIPVILITLIGAAYIIVLKPPTYTSNAEILLVYPPSPPTAAQIAADPALSKINSNNPYLTYGNMVLVADVVIDVANSPTAGQTLQNEGVTTKYAVALENSFQNPPVIQVSGTGDSSAVAIQAATLVTAQVLDGLREIQAEQNVNPTYMITGEEFVKPTVATTSSSSKLRTLIGFAALGLVLMLIAVSIAQTLEKRRKARPAKPRSKEPKASKGSGGPKGPQEARGQEPASARPDSRPDSRPDPRPDSRPDSRPVFGGDPWRRPDSPDNRPPDREQDPRGASVGGHARPGRWPS